MYQNLLDNLQSSEIGKLSKSYDGKLIKLAFFPTDHILYSGNHPNELVPIVNLYSLHHKFEQIQLYLDFETPNELVNHQFLQAPFDLQN